jgi:nicotinate-nucleotide--dimethylbenzimidazole phosphoribosyltransferase
MGLEDILRDVKPFDEAARRAAHEHWAGVAKPLGSLGELELLVEKVAGIQGTPEVDVGRRCVAVLCADNGVVAQGVTQTTPDVTATVARQLAQGTSSVCTMARAANADVRAYDLGMLCEVDGVPARKVARGTADMTQGPAMSRADALACIEAGAKIAAELAGQGYRVLATGEMGIGNTTTSAAVTCALLGMPAEEAVGRGAGLDDAGLARKVRAVRRALEANRPDADDPVNVLACVGGFDIAGLVGLYLGGAARRVPVVVDGLISSVAALAACRIDGRVRDFMLASHVSSEPAAKAVMGELGLSPVIHAGMHLGEGTGAVCLFPLLDVACALYARGKSFAEYGMDAYKEQGR